MIHKSSHFTIVAALDCNSLPITHWCMQCAGVRLTSRDQRRQVEKEGRLTDDNVVAGVAHVMHPRWGSRVLVPGEGQKMCCHECKLL